MLFVNCLEPTFFHKTVIIRRMFKYLISSCCFQVRRKDNKIILNKKLFQIILSRVCGESCPNIFIRSELFYIFSMFSRHVLRYSGFTPAAKVVSYIKRES